MTQPASVTFGDAYWFLKDQIDFGFSLKNCEPYWVVVRDFATEEGRCICYWSEAGWFMDWNDGMYLYTHKEAVETASHLNDALVLNLADSLRAEEQLMAELFSDFKPRRGAPRYATSRATLAVLSSKGCLA